MYTMQDLRTLSVKDLEAELGTAMTELYDHGLRIKLGQEHTHHKLEELRVYIARINTVKKQKQREELQKNASN